jgi:hypothetical protein
MSPLLLLLLAIAGAFFFVLILVGVLIFVLGRRLTHLAQRQPSPPHGTPPKRDECWPIPAHRYRRPDPLIYSQEYLMAQGLAVTWDNPDIWLERNGQRVPPHSLQPATTYDVIARVWNGSVEAPAVNLPVRFSYLSFGVGTTRTPIGTTVVDLPVKGAAGCPTFASQTWTTPPVPGHYCLTVELLWSDDANPLNNVGQTNTDVKPLNSPHATFTFAAANTGQQLIVYNFVVDAYALLPQLDCGDTRPAPFPTMSDTELRERVRIARARHDRLAFPVPAGWELRVEPAQLELPPGEQRDVTVYVTAPDGFSGQQAFNVHAFSREQVLLGGVTLYVRG